MHCKKHGTSDVHYSLIINNTVLENCKSSLWYNNHVSDYTVVLVCIRESVDSLCRDGANMPISLNIQNCSKLPNAAVISLFRHITWSRSSSV